MRDELCGCGEDKKKGVEITKRRNCTKKNGVPSGLTVLCGVVISVLSAIAV